MAYIFKKKTFWKSVWWLIAAIIFGQIQLWLVWFKTTGNLLTANDLTYNKILMDGYILFFCTGVTTSLGLDYWFNNKYFKKTDSIYYFLGPVVILFISILIGNIIIGQDYTQVNMPFVRILHTILIIFTSTYIMFIKTNEFSRL